MGISNSVFYCSAIPDHGCSARNITWQYLHNDGIIPPPYSDCPYVAAILDFNNCDEGFCANKGWPFGVEYMRYEEYDWHGLGDPLINRIPRDKQTPEYVNVTMAEGGEEATKTTEDWSKITAENFYTSLPDDRYDGIIPPKNDHEKHRRKKKMDGLDWEIMVNASDASPPKDMKMKIWRREWRLLKESETIGTSEQASAGDYPGSYDEESVINDESNIYNPGMPNFVEEEHRGHNKLRSVDEFRKLDKAHRRLNEKTKGFIDWLLIPCAVVAILYTVFWVLCNIFGSSEGGAF